MIKKVARNDMRKARHTRIREKISGTKVIAFKKSKYYPVKKTLKTKDTLYSIYPANPNGQFGKGITLQIVRNGLSGYALCWQCEKIRSGRRCMLSSGSRQSTRCLR